MKAEGTMNQIVEGFASEFRKGVDEVKHNCTRKHTQQLEKNKNHNFYIPRADEVVISMIIDQMNSNKAPGPDEIRYKYLKIISNLIAPALASAINQSLNEGVFPEYLKTSIVRPIYKKGQRNKFGNYRPIALLPALGKIFEKYVAKYLSKYLRECNLISRFQYAYQKGKSTEGLMKEVSD